MKSNVFDGLTYGGRELGNVAIGRVTTVASDRRLLSVYVPKRVGLHTANKQARVTQQIPMQMSMRCPVVPF